MMGAALRIVRLLLLVVWFFGLAFGFLIFACFRPFRISNGLWYCRVLTPITLRIMGVRFILRNEERLRSDRPAIFIGNHQSTLDFFFYGWLVPDNTATIVKQGIIWIPIFGGLYLLSNNFFVHRQRRQKAARKMKKIEKCLVENSRSFMIFPEGTRSLDRGLGRFKSGAFRLAAGTGFPVQPIVVSTYYQRLDLTRWNAGTVIAEVLEPMPTRGADRQELRGLMESAHRAVLSTVSRLDDELSASRG